MAMEMTAATRTGKGSRCEGKRSDERCNSNDFLHDDFLGVNSLM
jgi:hypothetical protein